jgi:hypothetical protein
MNDESGRYIATEYGPVWKPGKPKKRMTPEGSLKKRCRQAYKAWKLDHPDVPCRMLKYSVGDFQAGDGRHYALGTVGTGDMLIGICSTCLMVETKIRGRGQSSSQIKMQEDWQATGNKYALVYEPIDLINALNDIVRGHIF